MTVVTAEDRYMSEILGFHDSGGSVHMARTMMLHELSILLDSVKDSSAEQLAYVEAIERQNCLGKRSHQTRMLTRRHLVQLYALSPNITLFRALRFFWQRDPEGRPLITLLCAYARDPLLRASASFVLKMSDGHVVSRETLEEHLDVTYPGRFSKATLTSTAQNLASTWTQAGHVIGRVNKTRTRAIATAGATAYALMIGFLKGERGESLFRTEYAGLLDCDVYRRIELAETASRKGWIVSKRIGKVIEVLFPNVLTPQELEWAREQA